MALVITSLAPLVLDRDAPYEQIARVWTAVFDRHEMPCLPSSLRAWAAEAIAETSTLPIPEDKRDDARSMLVWLCLFDLVDNPEAIPASARDWERRHLSWICRSTH